MLHKTGEWVKITTPYLDRHGDCMQTYAKRANVGLLLTDGRDTITDLEQNGCRPESHRRQELPRMTASGFGVQLKGKALRMHAVAGNFALRKHSLVQTMLIVSDLSHFATPTVASLFQEDVIKWLDSHGVCYIPKVAFSG